MCLTPHEVEALQSRAREYTWQQLEEMDEWERALHREWVSFVSMNVMSFPYPMEGTLEDGTTTSESIQTTPAFQDWNNNATSRGMATSNIRSRGRTRPGMTGVLTPGGARTSSSSEGITHASWNPISFPYQMEGTLEDGMTTSGSTQTTIASRLWNSNTLPRGMVLQRDRLTGRTRILATGEFTPEREGTSGFRN